MVVGRGLAPTGWVVFTLVVFFGCSKQASAPRGEGAAQTGHLKLAWTLSNGAEAINCNDVGAVTVNLSALRPSAAFGVSESFTCGAMSGITREMPAGTYDVTVQLAASGSRALTAESIKHESVEITAGHDTELPAAEFDVVPMGALEFAVATSDTPDNCGTDGSNIQNIDLQVQDPDGTCVPVLFTIDDNPPVAQACNGSFALSCFPRTARVKVTGLRSGPSKLEVVGTRAGNVACYNGSLDFVVPGNSLNVNIGTVQLPVSSDIQGCAL